MVHVISSIQYQNMPEYHNNPPVNLDVVDRYLRQMGDKTIPDEAPARPSVLVLMTSSNENIFRVTGPLYGEFSGHR